MKFIIVKNIDIIIIYINIIIKYIIIYTTIANTTIDFRKKDHQKR